MKEMRSSFSATDPIAEQFREIAGVELRAALRVAGDPALATDKRIHDARLRMKRLRALLRLVRSGFADYAAENRAARDASGGLSELRDAAVLQDTLAELLRESGRPKRAGEALVAAIARRIPSAPAQQMALAGFVAATAPVLERSARWRLEREDPGLIIDNAVATYRRARKAFHLAERAPLPTDFHEWRKQVKYQLYQLGFLGCGKRKPAAVPALLRRLSDLLGLYCDREMFRLFLAEQPDRRDFGWLDDLAADSQAKLARKALKLGTRLYRLKPGQWRAQLERYGRPAGGRA